MLVFAVWFLNLNVPYYCILLLFHKTGGEQYRAICHILLRHFFRHFELFLWTCEDDTLYCFVFLSSYLHFAICNLSHLFSPYAVKEKQVFMSSCFTCVYLAGAFLTRLFKLLHFTIIFWRKISLRKDALFSFQLIYVRHVDISYFCYETFTDMFIKLRQIFIRKLIWIKAKWPKVM